MAGSGYAASYVAPGNGLIVQGNVGIGTTSPGKLLEVVGEVVSRYSSSAAPAIDIQGTSTGATFWINNSYNSASPGTGWSAAMSVLILLLAAGIIASSASPVRADTVVFPPLGCSGDAQYITWLNGNATQTTCQSGQQILSNAIPACAAGQDVAFDGSRFYCKSPASVPTCGANEFLSFNGTSYECRNAGIPACGSNQVLTFNGLIITASIGPTAFPPAAPTSFSPITAAISVPPSPPRPFPPAPPTNFLPPTAPTWSVSASRNPALR